MRKPVCNEIAGGCFFSSSAAPSFETSPATARVGCTMKVGTPSVPSAPLSADYFNLALLRFEATRMRTDWNRSNRFVLLLDECEACADRRRRSRTFRNSAPACPAVAEKNDLPHCGTTNNFTDFRGCNLGIRGHGQYCSSLFLKSSQYSTTLLPLSLCQQLPATPMA
jgi:hypothetical protein